MPKSCSGPTTGATRRRRIAWLCSGRLPTDITLQVTFEMFEPIHHDGVVNTCVDYTIASIGPGRYFASEAAVAHERGIPLYTMANTGGLTWDFGDIPYQPVPQQWNRRHQALKAAHDDWGLSGVMESHHFGWWPSIVSELAKASYWSPSPDPDATILAIAERDFGAGADQAVAAWQAWSDATNDYIPTNEDQYGPFRIGPAYPLSFLATPRRFQVSETAMFGDMIVITPYTPENNLRRNKTAAPIRINAEIASLTRMKAKWELGIRLLEQAIARAPEHQVAGATSRCSRWAATFRMRSRPRSTPSAGGSCVRASWSRMIRQWPSDLLDQLVAVGEDEIANCEAAIPIVEADSRLGWEPTMEYLGDADAHPLEDRPSPPRAGQRGARVPGQPDDLRWRADDLDFPRYPPTPPRSGLLSGVDPARREDVSQSTPR